MPTSSPDRPARPAARRWPLLLPAVLPGLLAYRYWEVRSGLNLGLLLGSLLLWAAAFRSARLAEYSLTIGISGIFLDLMLRELDPARFGEALGGIAWLPLATAVGVMTLALLLLTERWRYLLRTVKPLPFGTVFASQMIGFFGNAVLPAKAGEFLKAYHLGTKAGISRTAVLATVFLERALDGMVIVLFLAGSLPLFAAGERGLLPGAAAAIGLYAGSFSGLLLLQRWPGPVTALALKFSPASVRDLVREKLAKFLSGLALLGSFRQVAIAFLLSLAGWWLIAFSMYPLLGTLGPAAAALPPLATPLLLIAIIAIGQSLPAAPAGIGVLNWSFVFGMQLLFRRAGAPVSDGLYAQLVVLSLQVQLVMVVPEGLLGYGYFLRDRRWLRLAPLPAAGDHSGAEPSPQPSPALSAGEGEITLLPVGEKGRDEGSTR